MTDHPSPISAPGLDQVVAFSLPGLDSRGRVVRLGPALDKILSAHAYPPAIACCLAEALVLTALMGSLLKGQGDQLTMQIQARANPAERSLADSDRPPLGGLIRLLVADYRDGALRGYAETDAHQAGPLPDAQLPLETLFGPAGHLAITFEVASTGRRYQGIVPLEGACLAQAVETYFRQSEQVPALLRTAVHALDGGFVAGGLLVQHLAEGEAGRVRRHAQLDHPHWEHLASLAATISPAELVDPALSLEALLWRLFHEEERIHLGGVVGLSRGCRCSEAHFERVLARFPKEDRREMANEEGVILVDCAFCSREFAIQD